MTDRELLRQNVRDETAPYTWDDPTLDDLLARYGNDVNLASAHVWMWRAGDASKRNFKFQQGGVMVDKTMTADECRQQAALFRQLAQLDPAAEVAEIDWTEMYE